MATFGCFLGVWSGRVLLRGDEMAAGLGRAESAADRRHEIRGRRLAYAYAYAYASSVIPSARVEVPIVVGRGARHARLDLRAAARAPREVSRRLHPAPDRRYPPFAGARASRDPLGRAAARRRLRVRLARGLGSAARGDRREGAREA